MPTYRDEAVVLRTHKLGEADRIITMLSRRRGKIRAVAKGVRRTSSKFGARLEPFSHVDLQFAEGRTLDVVTQVESLDAFGEPLTSDYPAYTAGQVMLETADRLVPEEGEPAIQQYQLLVGALRVLEPGHQRRAATRHDDLGLLPAAGARGRRLRPVLHRLRPLRPGRTAPGLLPAAGGVVCERCRPAGSARPAPETLPLLGALLEGRWEDTRDVHACSGPGGQRAHRGLRGLAPGPQPAIAGPCRALTLGWLPPTGPPGPAWWPPPTPPIQQPRPVAYVFAIVLPLVLDRRHGGSAGRDLGPAAGGRDRPAPGRRTPAPPTAGRGSATRTIPQAGNSGYDVAKYQIVLNWDPGTATLRGTTTISARATQRLDSFYLDLALCPPRRQGERQAGDVRPPGLR